MVETIWQDMRYGARMLRRKPGFTAVAVLALGLGIGANTAIFSVVNAVMLRPLPFPQPDRLVRVWESNPGRSWPEFSASQPNYYDWVQQNQVFESLAAQQGSTFNLTGDGEPERIIGAYATANLFHTLGATPAHGRSFVADEDRPGADRVVVLSHGLWQRRFGSDAALVGKTIRLNGESHTVIGVLPAEFSFIAGIDLWVPLARDLAQSDRSNHILSVFGRLKPGISLEQATADLTSIAENLERQFPASNGGWGVRLRSFYDWIVPEATRKSMLILFAAVGFVLLIACVNVANLLLAHAAGRQREMAIRAALGASRARVIRQLLTESLLLSSLGAIVGVLLALWGTHLLTANNDMNIPRLDETSVDGRALAFTMSSSLLTGLIFGMVPAWKASKPNLDDALKEGGRTGAGGSRHRLQSALVVSEIALALVLLVGAGLMIRSFTRLQQAPLGFAPDNVMTMQINLPGSKYAEGPRRVEFFNRLLERLRDVPGVVDAAAISQVPFSGGNWAMEATLEGRDGAGEPPISADTRAVTPGYFRTMGIPLVHGRYFTEQDRDNSPLTLIVSEKFAERCWPGEDPIGKRFKAGTGNPFGTVVGVVGNVRSLSLDDAGRPAFYFAYGHIAMPRLTVVIHTKSEPEALTAAFRSQVLALDDELPIFNIRPMSQIVSSAAGQPRFQTVLLGSFAALALLLAAVGTYGVMSFAVAERRHEVGVRMALGARPGDVIRMIVWEGARLSLGGVAAGILAAFALTRVMASLLFEVSATDPLTFILTSSLLTGVALAACFIPARRATRVDPMTALRQQ
ncbi:MAG TPA: ABC transporter permease [Blastocatellia bacterium]|nr:ABC transporter permease [Blastocatellia bacterium]